MNQRAALFEAYRRTRYLIDGDGARIVMRIGEPSADLDRLLERAGATTAAFITAYNPFSRPTAEAINLVANRRLGHDLRDCCGAVLPGKGEGDDGPWPPEPSFLAIGISREMAENLGRKYQQYAIVWAERGHVPVLAILFDEPA
jgi:hypothetical protein